MYNLKNFSNLVRKKKDLLFCIFLTLIIQLIITIYTVKKTEKINFNLIENMNRFLFIFLYMIVIYILFFGMLTSGVPFIVRQILFVIFSILTGILLSLGTKYIEKEVIQSAVYSTLITFVLMFLVGLIIVYLNYDLSYYSLFLFFILLVVIIISIINIFVKSEKVNKIITIIGVLLFSAYILYDTNIILNKYQNKNGIDCIKGSLNYYLDIQNLFTSFLRLRDN